MWFPKLFQSSRVRPRMTPLVTTNIRRGTPITSTTTITTPTISTTTSTPMSTENAVNTTENTTAEDPNVFCPCSNCNRIIRASDQSNGRQTNRVHSPVPTPPPPPPGPIIVVMIDNSDERRPNDWTPSAETGIVDEDGDANASNQPLHDEAVNGEVNDAVNDDADAKVKEDEKKDADETTEKADAEADADKVKEDDEDTPKFSLEEIQLQKQWNVMIKRFEKQGKTKEEEKDADKDDENEGVAGLSPSSTSVNQQQGQPSPEDVDDLTSRPEEFFKRCCYRDKHKAFTQLRYSIAAAKKAEKFQHKQCQQPPSNETKITTAKGSEICEQQYYKPVWPTLTTTTFKTSTSQLINSPPASPHVRQFLRNLSAGARLPPPSSVKKPQLNDQSTQTTEEEESGEEKEVEEEEGTEEEKGEEKEKEKGEKKEEEVAKTPLADQKSELVKVDEVVDVDRPSTSGVALGTKQDEEGAKKAAGTADKNAQDKEVLMKRQKRTISDAERIFQVDRWLKESLNWRRSFCWSATSASSISSGSSCGSLTDNTNHSTTLNGQGKKIEKY